MTSPGSAQHPAAESACRIALGQVNQVRPKLPLLKVLQAAGAQGDTFTLKEVMHYLGQYIMVRQLYDKRQQHMVYCGGDQLGELLGLESFSVKDPSPVYDMLKRNLTSAAMADAAQSLAKEQSVDKPSQDQLKFSHQEGSDIGIMEGESNASALTTSEQKCENYEDKDLIENLSKSKKPKLDLVFEEWDVAGLPWWFLGNLRSNYESRSNGSTDIQTNQDFQPLPVCSCPSLSHQVDIDTAVVSDTTDDLWFLNECPLDLSSAAVKVEAVDCEEVKEGDSKVVEDACSHDLEDSQYLSDDTDTEATSEDCWQCTKCRKFNSPGKRYCYRCWALRKDWYSDCPKLAHSLSLSNIDAMQTKTEDDEGIDVPDCRRTISAPVGQPKELYMVENKSCVDPCSSIESLDLARKCESKESLLHFAEHKKEEEIQSLESIKKLLNPCYLCHHRPRDGNIVHGRTAHLVACFRCAKMLKRKRSPCPVCRKDIELVIRIFMG
ncbi:PREDICTED: LOW QUALITY PROTEIN: protein Mdm4 [Mesitornis unicolor]|uniref:LOW QUALITY PROTEIN: protein Mdm4 n=1 Tax=Mesitornis unicolor TaxID=54374 RepID=UPI0005287729|nr:PREDICTED: LOW QUALITY PROTEIN: protein Mdm4 [Mesitornis unicolor]